MTTSNTRPRLKGEFTGCMQGEQVMNTENPNDEFMYSFVNFVIFDPKGKPHAGRAMVKQTTGSRYADDPLEVHPIHYLKDPGGPAFNYGQFRDLVANYYKTHIVGTHGAVGVGAGARNITMIGNEVSGHRVPFEVDAADGSPGGGW